MIKRLQEKIVYHVPIVTKHNLNKYDRTKLVQLEFLYVIKCGSDLM